MQFTRWQILARLLATAVLAGSAMYAVLLGFSLLMFGGVLYGGAAACFAIACAVAIWQAWKRPVFSIVTWLMLALGSAWMTYSLAALLYQSIVLRDLAIPLAQGSNAFELVYEGHDKNSLPVLHIGYALRAGFTDIRVGDERYRQVGLTPGIYLREQATGQRPRYRVVERVLKRNARNSVNWPRRGDISLIVTDTHTGVNIGHWHGPRAGWPGPQAGNFLKSVLQPVQAKALSQRDYPAGSATLTASGMAATLSADQANQILAGCPGGYAVVPSSATQPRELHTPNWDVGLADDTQDIVCSSDGVFIFLRDGFFQDFHCIWLSGDGKLLGEVHAKIPELPKETWTVQMSRMVAAEVKEGKLHARRAIFPRPSGTASLSSLMQIDIVAPIAMTK